MGRPVKKLELSSQERSELERGYRAGKSHAYRKRCHMMLINYPAASGRGSFIGISQTLPKARLH
jgi:hypothetical protein